MSDVFISYSRKDLALMERLSADLARQGITVWSDQRDLRPGTREWQKAIETAIVEAKCVVVLMTPRAKESEWVGLESSYARSMGVMLIPWLGDGDTRTSVPIELMGTQRIDATKDYGTALAELVAALGGNYLPLKHPTVTTREGAPTWEEDAQLNECIVLLSGSFLMGSPEGDNQRRYDERPQHSVRLTSFYIQEHQVTNEEYRRFDPSHELEGSEKHPVVNVNWFQAMDYAEWLGGTLPTEAQWEYAARARTTTRWACGDDEAQLREYAWFCDNSADTTHPVAQKLPNAWGLYDMHGNVWEWCRDRYGDYPEEEQSDPLGPSTGSEYVLRGGCYFNDPPGLRSACRYRGTPEEGAEFIGFRVVWYEAQGPELSEEELLDREFQALAADLSLP